MILLQAPMLQQAVHALPQLKSYVSMQLQAVLAVAVSASDQPNIDISSARVVQPSCVIMYCKSLNTRPGLMVWSASHDLCSGTALVPSPLYRPRVTEEHNRRPRWSSSGV